MGFNLGKLRDISLKWKLLIPFLFLPTALTVMLLALWIASQLEVLHNQEKGRMEENYLRFDQMLERRLVLASAVAELVALNPETQEALAEKDRDKLIRLYEPVYERLKRLPGIKQFHFHLHDPPRSFLRLHSLSQFGDDLEYRQTIKKAHESREVISGLEFGLTGWSLRGVAPVFHQGRDVGSVEIGTDLGLPFLERLKKDFDCDLSVYVQDPGMPGGFRLLAGTAPERTFLATQLYAKVLNHGASEFLLSQRREEPLAVLVGPIFGFGKKPSAVTEMSRNRSGALKLIRQNTYWIAGLGMLILVLALAFVLWVSKRFLRPIHTLVDQAERITAGEQVFHVTVDRMDEFGILAVALNKMVGSLEDHRHILEEYAHDLEDRVRARTEDLVRSEEKFRTLVENIPLVIYRLEKNLLRTFVSSHIEGLTGWLPEELVGGPEIWTQTIHPEDRAQVLSGKKRALNKGLPFEMEYRLQDREGQTVEILDHAEPIKNENEKALYLEGYMMDIRERRSLEEQILKAEELKTLSDISSRLAHEFRNPLSVLGLAARRLEKVLGQDNTDLPYPKIIIEQVGRLERILSMIQQFIKPLDLNTVEVDTAHFFRQVVRDCKKHLAGGKMALLLEISQETPRLVIDPTQMTRALCNLIRNAAYQMPPKGTLALTVRPDGQQVEIALVYPAGYLSDDQLRHFFYPFTTEDADASLADLALAPVIVHKHGGMINVGRESEDLVAVTINLPVKEPEVKE